MENTSKKTDDIAVPKPMKGFNTINKEDIITYIQNQRNKSWDIYSERSFIENLFCQRINYFILTYSLVITASAMLHTQIILFCTSLLSGIILLSCIWASLCRAYIKLDVILRIIHELPAEDNVFQLYQNEVNSLYKFKNVRINKCLAHILPFTCVCSLVILLVLGIIFRENLIENAIN